MVEVRTRVRRARDMQQNIYNVRYICISVTLLKWLRYLTDISTMEIRIGGGDLLGPALPKVRDALIKALYEATEYPYTNTSYPPGEGVPQLREAVAEYYRKRWHIEYESSQVVVTCGAWQGVAATMNALLKPGDEVLITDPGYVDYYNSARDINVKAVPVPCRKEKWHFYPEDFKKAVTDKTRMFIHSNPSNPTGSSMTKEEWEAVEDVAEERDLLVLSDEIYKEIVYDGKDAILPAQFKGLKERTIATCSLSKISNGPGFRVGLLLIPEELYPKIMKYIIVYMGRARPATFVQLGAVAAYTEPRNHVKEIREEYEKRRDFIVPRLNEIEGLSCPMYEGSIYPFVDITQLGIKTADFVKELRQKEKVSVRDGESMGVNLSKGKLRLCVREPVPVLEEACDRMERFVKSLKK